MALEPEHYVAQWFEDILRRCQQEGGPATLCYAERVVYYGVSARTEADVNGFCAVFEQLLYHEEDLSFFVRSLAQLGEDDLAVAFAEIRRLLVDAGYFEDPTREFHALRAEALERFAALEKRVLGGDRLWQLDAKLSQLPRGSTVSSGA